MIIKYKKLLPYLAALLCCAWVFLNWGISPINLGGDFSFVNYDHYRLYSSAPYVWDLTLNNGFGQYVLFTLPFFFYNFTVGKIATLINNPFILHKIIFLFPLLCTAYVSAIVSARTFLQDRWARATSIILYLCNPYFIMLTSGGQMGVAFAYAFAPAVFSTAFLIVKQQDTWSKPKRFAYTVLFGLLLSILIAFDSRLALLVLCSIIILILLDIALIHKNIRAVQRYSLLLFFSLIIVAGFHAYWLLPSIFLKSISLPNGYDNSSSVSFFSFARFAHTVSWMHPNYPDNIFGVVKEVSGVVLLIPVLAFWTLRKNRKSTLFLTVLALSGAFFAKGTNEPFGEMYKWMFQHIPLFSWFRDSTKFYVIISLGYSILVARTIEEIDRSLKPNIKKAIISLIILLLVYTWWPTFSHNVTGTLAYRTYPQVHSQIQQILVADKSFGRVLWVPQRDLYGYTDLNHVQVTLSELRTQPNCMSFLCLPQKKQQPESKYFSKQDQLAEVDQLLSFLQDPYTQTIFQELAINYVVLNPDYDKTKYTYDQKYDESLKQYYQQKLEAVSWLQKIKTDNNIYIASTVSPGGLFTSRNSLALEVLPFKMINPQTYEVYIKDTGSSLVFNQTYSNRWVLTQNNTTVMSNPSKFGMNEFPTNNLSKGKAKITFTGTVYVNIGFTIALVTILLVVGFLIIYTIKAKENKKGNTKSL